MKDYFIRVLIAIDQLINTFLNGSPDETLSARAYRCNWKLLVYFINAMFLDINHCKDSWLSEKNRKHLPDNYSIN